MPTPQTESWANLQKPLKITVKRFPCFYDHIHDRPDVGLEPFLFILVVRALEGRLYGPYSMVEKGVVMMQGSESNSRVQQVSESRSSQG